MGWKCGKCGCDWNTQTFCLGCGEHINSHVHDEPKDDGPRKGPRAGSVSRVHKIEDKELSRKIAEMFKDAEEALRFAVEKREEEQRREMLPWNLPQDRI